MAADSDRPCTLHHSVSKRASSPSFALHFPVQDLLDHPRVRAGFSQALNMMNSAADGQPLPYPAAAAAAGGAAAAAGGSIPSWRMEVEPDSAAAAAAATGEFGRARLGAGPAVGQAGPEPSFRDLVGQYAQEQGLEFLPRAGRLHDGLPVYSFGGVSCVVDASRGMVRAQLKGRGWVPVSLEGLKAEALSKGGGK
jgi:tuftelin-interacting protein 11